MVKYLCQRIGEEMEKFHEYHALSGLRAVNLTHKGRKESIPENSKIGDHIKDCDELTCDIVSEDMWLSVRFEMECAEKHKSSAMALQVLKNGSVAYLRWVTEKLALNLWSYLNSHEATFYYLLKSITLKIVFAPAKYPYAASLE